MRSSGIWEMNEDKCDVPLGLALPCLEFHSRSRCTTMCSQWESDERARTCVCNTHTNIYSLTHTHTALLFTLRLRFLVGSCSRLFPSSFALCSLFPILPFCTCHGNIYRHFFLPLFLGEFSCSTRLLLFSFFVLISFPLLFRSHTFTPLFIPYCFRQVLPNVCSISCCLLWGATECGRLLIEYI